MLSSAHVDDARALAAARAALQELSELVQRAPELVPEDAAELASVLERVEFISGDAPTPDAVAVLDPLALRARRVRALFLCGLQEGVFPARTRQHALLSEEQRRSIAQASGLLLGDPEDALAAERYLLYAAVSRPEQLLRLSWHTADDEGLATPRSLFVDDLCDLFDASLQERCRRRALGELGSSACERSQRAACAGASSLAHAGAAAPPGAPPDSPAPLGTPPAPAPPLAPNAPAPLGTSQAPSVRDEQLLAAMRARPWSASSLEGWMRCPMRWFVERMLTPDGLEPDAEPLARGALAHAALRDTLHELREQTGSARLEPRKLELALELLRGALQRAEVEHPLSRAPERVPGARRRLRAELERYLEHAAVCASPLEPDALELGFGFSEEGSLPAYDLGDGVLLRGRIDRVDMSDAGDAVVYDYKASVAPPSARWLPDHSIQVALYMLAVEGLLGRRVAGGFYQPLSGEDLRARGVIDADSAIELDCVRTDVREHSELRELLDGSLELARSAAAEARAGQLQARPQTCSFQGGCMFPSICRCEP